MKNFNRRDFLKLTGLTALALTFSACGSSAPSVPSQDAQSLFDAINAYRVDKGLNKFTYDTDLAAYAALNAECFETQGKTTISLETYGNWLTSRKEDYDAVYGKLLVKDIQGSTCMPYGTTSTETEMTLTAPCPATEEELQTQLDAMAAKFGSVKKYYIGIALATISGQPYWIAVVAEKLSED